MVKVGIVGRPNVGKSSLFNKFIGRKRSIAYDKPGVTRDRLYERCRYQNKSFDLIDTPGFDKDLSTSIKKGMMTQIKMVIDEADIVVILLDGSESPNPIDREIISFVREHYSGKVIYAINKVDNEQMKLNQSEFYRLGVENPCFTSVSHSAGIEALLDEITETIPEDSDESDETATVVYPKFTIVGRPNAGKSSLINRMLNKERMIVSDIPGTTIDTVEVVAKYNQKPFILVDTPGVRKKAKVTDDLEQAIVSGSMKAIRESDVVIVLIDCTEGLSSQDMKLISYAEEEGKGIIIAMNKSDLLPKEEKVKVGMMKSMDESLRQWDFVPKIMISVESGQNVTKVFAKAFEVFESLSGSISMSHLTKTIQTLFKSGRFPKVAHPSFRILYAVQSSKCPIEFTVFTNAPYEPPASFTRFLIHQIRNEYSFAGCPIHVKFKRRMMQK